jgi:hypothetical protein
MSELHTPMYTDEDLVYEVLTVRPDVVVSSSHC